MKMITAKYGNEGDEIRPGFLDSAVVLNNKLYICDAYLTNGCLLGDSGGNWTYTETDDSSPDLDNIVKIRNQQNEEILICKDDEEFYYSDNFLNWTPLPFSDEDSESGFPEYIGGHKLTTFRNHLFIVALNYGKISSAELFLSDDYQLKKGAFASVETAD